MTPVPTVTRPIVFKRNVAILDIEITARFEAQCYHIFISTGISSLVILETGRVFDREKKIDNIFKTITRIHISMYMCIYVYKMYVYVHIYMQMYTLHASSPTYSCNRTP